MKYFHGFEMVVWGIYEKNYYGKFNCLASRFMTHIVCLLCPVQFTAGYINDLMPYRYSTLVSRLIITQSFQFQNDNPTFFSVYNIYKLYKTEYT